MTKPFQFQFRRCFLDLYPGERIRYEVVLHDGTIIGYVSGEYGRQWHDTRWFAWNHQGLRAEEAKSRFAAAGVLYEVYQRNLRHTA